MKLRVNGWGRGGLANPGDVSGLGGGGHRLSAAGRITIMRGRDAGLSHAEIGKQIGRDRSVVYREIRRNRNSDGDYHALMAHGRAADRACRPKECKLKDNPLCALIEAWMDDGWSPKLIADMLARDHRDDRQARVSHETIYQSLYVQTRGSLRADLHQCLSTKRAARKPRGRYLSRGVYSASGIHHQRPSPEAEDRAVPGHWEGDLIVGPQQQRDRHPGGAQHPFHPAAAPAYQPQCPDSGRRDDRGDERAAGTPTALHHLGPG